MKDKDLTHKIIGAAMEVHTHLGHGFQEEVYQSALEYEFRLQHINFFREQEVEVKYRGHPVGSRTVDFLVEDRVLVEIKAVINLEDIHLVQAKHCLDTCGLEMGVLINFGSKSLEFKRVHKNNPDGIAKAKVM